MLAGYGNLDEQFSEYLRWIKWVVRLTAVAGALVCLHHLPVVFDVHPLTHVFSTQCSHGSEKGA